MTETKSEVAVVDDTSAWSGAIDSLVSRMAMPFYETICGMMKEICEENTIRFDSRLGWYCPKQTYLTLPKTHLTPHNAYSGRQNGWTGRNYCKRSARC